MYFVSYSVFISFNSDKVFHHRVANVCGTMMIITGCRAELVQGRRVILMAFRQTSLSSSEVAKDV